MRVREARYKSPPCGTVQYGDCGAFRFMKLQRAPHSSDFAARFQPKSAWALTIVKDASLPHARRAPPLLKETPKSVPASRSKARDQYRASRRSCGGRYLDEYRASRRKWVGHTGQVPPQLQASQRLALHTRSQYRTPQKASVRQYRTSRSESVAQYRRSHSGCVGQYWRSQSGCAGTGMSVPGIA
eukprot:1913800-Rhodomonas_salina.3